MSRLNRKSVPIRPSRGLGYFQLFLFIFIFLNLLPGGFIMETVNIAHFFSSLHMFEYASHHGFRYGIDIIDNVGPYGYLHYPYIYAGSVYWTKILWFSLVCGIYAYYATCLIEKMQTLPEKLIFLLVVTFFPLQLNFPWFSFEIIPRLAILFSALYFLMDHKEKKDSHETIPIVFNGFFYAFLILEKASNVYYLMLILVVLSVYWLIQKKWHNILWLLGSVIAGVLLFWFAAGQPFSGLLTYFESMRFFIDAYQNSMSLPMGSRDFHYGLFYCISIAIILLVRFITSFYITPSLQEFFRSILIAALVFLVWKHGMLRSTHSYGTFLYTMPILISFVCLYPMKVRPHCAQRNNIEVLYSHPYFPLFRSLLCITLLFVVWKNMNAHERPTSYYLSISQEFSNRLTALFNYKPVAKSKQLNAQMAQLKHDNALPVSLKNTLGRHSVDEFGSVPELLLLNDLNYKPRPVPINFIVTNAALNDKNANHYQNRKTAPDFVFLPDIGMHMTDNKAYLSLLLNYEVIESVQQWFVLQKKTAWQRISFSNVGHRQARVDQWVSLEGFQQSFLWVQVEATPSLLGQMKDFLYKPDYFRLDVLLKNGFTQHYNLSFSQLRSGFLLNPIINTKTASSITTHGMRHEAYWANEPHWTQADAFRLTPGDTTSHVLVHPEFKITFSTIESTSSTSAHPIALDLSRAHNLIHFFSPNFNVTQQYTRFPINLLGDAPRYDISIDGLGTLEKNAMNRWRWALGPMTRISFYCNPVLPDSARKLVLQLGLQNRIPIPGQGVSLRLNGKIIYHSDLDNIHALKPLEADIAIAARKGKNTLEIVYNDWNHGTKNYTKKTNDVRTLAVEITRFIVKQEGKLGA